MEIVYQDSGNEKELKLEEALDRIDALLNQMGDKDVSLEETFRLYQEGMRLLKNCSEQIDRVEKQMIQIDEEGQIHEFS
ncbi:exodeoxyribonuclease VII small subunit [Lachnoclostridium sp. An196]|mgnify:FL=1|uniref:exodeoxyribonuclease VII small subunit n=1 Tax=Lachnoclostridium sp. An196 TaxID=1965583 RepID=UPI000B3AC821|nr:exodeoxyribonuclease VII small subunit [Lachnoclostridium sp. An196]OUP19099.1 exodeoxyribonuclease VII small subunit [Lachnoclostridium sp. An196]HIS06350.1 exodeoxyribonuclease VII small subunit [Candidatus Choladocola avistercoris]